MLFSCVTASAWVGEIHLNDAKQSEVRLRLLPPIVLGISLVICSLAQAKPKFNASEISGHGPQLMICDLDGDGLKDLVLLDNLNLSVFYQDRTNGFTREAQQTYHLEPRPCVVWAAKLGKRAGSLLVMTSDGISALDFTNRTGPPTLRQIIRQATIVPATAEDANALHLRLSVETGGDWPLLLAPAADGLQIWQHRDEWRQAQVIGHAVDSRLRPSLTNPGYTTSFEFNLSVCDVNGNGREDLMLSRGSVGHTNIYTLYLQQTNGLFDLEPALMYADKVVPNSWICWTDLNRDGKMDLIKSVWLDEPSFVPGIPSGKVLVSAYVADGHGKIPIEPQQVFRKNDWMPALPVVDVDGDGFPDLVLGYGHLDTREGVRKEITAKQLDYSLGFHFHRTGAGFPKEADCRRDVIIHLDRAALLLGASPQQYFERYVSLGGDFNGDGKRDLLVRDHGDEISVYFFLSRQKGFSTEPDLRFHCPVFFVGWEIADLNNDGVSDLIVKLENQKGFRVFTSQK